MEEPKWRILLGKSDRSSRSVVGQTGHAFFNCDFPDV